LVLVGIENATDQALAEQLQIDARQGYLFGKPEDVHRGAEK
jgi:EAL domain-containing protein (putative c-di-GMP-specific phosphodiesterase class I)